MNKPMPYVDDVTATKVPDLEAYVCHPVQLAAKARVLRIPAMDILLEGTVDNWCVDATLLIEGHRSSACEMGHNNKKEAVFALLKLLYRNGYLGDVIHLSGKE